ncbi:hypothetical protein MKleb_5437 (plasmid) [Klebsiella sp. PL-2018]|nr:hypothetical protein MKleb_5437 [Klebsiella sp. PL-2018]
MTFMARRFLKRCFNFLTMNIPSLEPIDPIIETLHQQMIVQAWLILCNQHFVDYKVFG